MGDFHLLDVPNLTDNFNYKLRTENMQTNTSYTFDERDIRAALVVYALSQNAGDGPVIDPDDLVFNENMSGEISANVDVTAAPTDPCDPE